MSTSDLFADNDPYDISLNINNESNEEIDYEITEDEVKKMLFDDDDEDFGSEKLDEFHKESLDDVTQGDNCLQSNLITLTDGEDAGDSSQTPENNAGIVKVKREDTDEEEEDDDDGERRHNKFGSERRISLTYNTEKVKRDIPDTLDKVVVKSELNVNVNFRNKKQKLSSPTKTVDSKSPPHKIHLNPHFKAPIPATIPSKSAHMPVPVLERKPMIRCTTPLFRSNHVSSNHLLPTPNDHFNHNMRPPDICEPSFSDQLIQNHSMSYEQSNTFGPHHSFGPQNPSNILHSNHLSIPSQSPVPYTSSGHWPSRNYNEVSPSWVNSSNHHYHGSHNQQPPVLNPLLSQSHQQYPQHGYPNNFHQPGNPYYDHSRGLQPALQLPPPPQPQPPLQRPMFPQEAPNHPTRFLPQQVFAARFPAQYPPTRPELPHFPRIEPQRQQHPRPPQVEFERFQVPFHTPEPPRVLLPRPPLMTPVLHRNPPPRKAVPTLPHPLPSTDHGSFSSDFGVLQRKEYFDSRSRPQHHKSGSEMEVTTGNLRSSVAKKFLNNSGKLSALKTVCNGSNESPKASPPVVKSPKKFAAKRPSYISIKQVEIVNHTSNTSVEDKAKEEPEPKPKKIIVADIEIDEEYQKKLEEQKRMREQLLKKKEERRKMMALQKIKEAEAQKKSK